MRAALAVSAGLAVAALGAQSAGAIAPGSFYPTGAMTVPRAGAVAAPLPDGRVLVAGGCCSGGSALRSAEIFDPTAGTFSQIGDMTVPRSGAVAAPLPDGRVLIAGGDASAEIYDPVSGAFSATGSMTVPR
jgi:Kelch motif